ncbi:MAG: hypothetical protein ACTS73_05170 [Arsenophonus sp. NEOnobi-MAG3]
MLRQYAEYFLIDKCSDAVVHTDYLPQQTIQTGIRNVIVDIKVLNVSGWRSQH